MAISYDFVKSVLREYNASERAAISLLVEKECRLDGVTDTMAIWDTANTYKAIILLAGGDVVSESVGGLSRSRGDVSDIISIYKTSYRRLLNRAGIIYVEEHNDKPSLPEVFT